MRRTNKYGFVGRLWICARSWVVYDIWGEFVGELVRGENVGDIILISD